MFFSLIRPSAIGLPISSWVRRYWSISLIRPLMRSFTLSFVFIIAMHVSYHLPLKANMVILKFNTQMIISPFLRRMAGK